MCGLAVFIGEPEHVAGSVRHAVPALEHRGPDDHGTWTSDDGRVGVAHVRLAVLDTTTAARQPMVSPSGRYVLAYNGEVYDHLRIRRELAGTGPAPRWRGTGDTETIAAALDRWGAEGTVRRCHGMFALAAWDREAGELLLARDRIGEKPLSHGRSGGMTFAVSDLRAIPPRLRSGIGLDPVALAMLDRFDHVADDRTVLEGVRRVPPGSVVRVDDRGAEVRRYWSVLDVPRRDARSSDPRRVVEDARDVIGAAVSAQRLSDVPLGVFLSGGIDSSLVAALLRREAGSVRTFTIGFEDPGFDESAFAADVARHLGTDHTEVRFTDAEVAATVPDLVTAFDEPLGDPSILPTALLCRITREHVTVALSGDGGDEVFGGYDQYGWHRRLRRRRRLARALGPALDVLAHAPRPVGRHARGLLKGRADDAVLFRRLRGRDDLGWAAPHPDVDRAWRIRWDAAGTRFGPDDVPLAVDLGWYLADDILVKVDRAAMGVSLETRAPLLDTEVVEFAFGLPTGLRTSRGPKWILRELLAREVPRALVERPKRGFGAPIPTWLRGPLGTWTQDLLHDAEQGGIEPWIDRARVLAVRRAWEAGTEVGWRLWTLVQVLAWERAWRAAP